MVRKTLTEIVVHLKINCLEVRPLNFWNGLIEQMSDNQTGIFLLQGKMDIFNF